MTAVCANLDIAPGSVCFAHTHSPLVGAPSTDEDRRWRLYNSGSWMWDRRLREHPRYRETSWPGTALRVCGPKIELVELLADLDERDLAAMVPAPAPAIAPPARTPKAPRRPRLALPRSSLPTAPSPR